MTFSSLYRLSLYAMLVFATLVLSVDATDNPFSNIYPVAVVVAALFAFLTVDRNPSLGISREVGNMLALGSVGLALLEYKIDNRLLLLALGHWLVYLQIVLMFRTKTVEDDWYLFGLGLVQVLVGTVISQSDTVGIMLFIWAILALWVLGLFSLRRDAARASGDGVTPGLPGGDRHELYPGLLNPAFVMSALRVTATTLALGGIIFLAMPRRTGAMRNRGGDSHVQHLTGFDDEVKLGQLGEILENDNVVMSIELFNEREERVHLGGEPLWRGVTMDVYNAGRWSRQRRRENSGTFPVRRTFPPASFGSPRTIRQRIKLEANDSNVLFGLRPMIDATTSQRYVLPDLNPLDGSIYVSDPRPGSFDYEVVSLIDPSLPQPGEFLVSVRRRNDLLRIPEEIRPQFEAIARGVIESKLPPASRDDPREKARVLEAYLRDSGQFGYTLKLDSIDPKIDPNVDFLLNRKEGHCEYFASALALLLRSVGVPSRVVNGFKGGDWTGIANVINVRQKHAHSWVEAYMGQVNIPEPTPLWLTLDPTPGNERDKSVARVGGYKANFRQLSDLVRYVWVFYIVGFNRDRQNRILYTPLQNLAGEARRGFRMIGAALDSARANLINLLDFPTVEAFISVRGFFVSFIGLLILAGLARGGVWLVVRVARWYRGGDARSAALAAGASHYRRLATLLAEFGLERPQTETQDEFARRASVFLGGIAPEPSAVSDVPGLVVDAYYKVRFGQIELPAPSQQFLEERLDTLEATMRATRS